MTPTRRQLLDLSYGESIRHGEMSARRAPVDPIHGEQVDPREVHFSKHYLEGKLTCIMADEVIADMVPDPWTLIGQRLDAAARDRNAHYRDGSRVR